MSASLQDYIKGLDRIALAALPTLMKDARLGAYDDDDEEIDDLPDVMDLGSATDDLVSDVESLGADLRPALLRRLRGRVQSINNAVKKAEAARPQLSPAVFRPMANLLKASSGLVKIASATAAQMRTAASIRFLQRPNNQTTIHVENLATATPTGTFTVRAPIAGRPFRFLGLSTEVATVGSATVPPTRGPIAVGFSSFNMLGVERVGVSNVSVSSGSLATAKWDFTHFSKLNEDREPQEKLYPWGIGPSGWFESDFSFTFVVRNDCGLAINAAITFYWQASPCEDETTGRGLYRGRSVIPVSAKRSASLFKNVMAYSAHPINVSGSEWSENDD